jgi:hypothetical protein
MNKVPEVKREGSPKGKGRFCVQRFTTGAGLSWQPIGKARRSKAMWIMEVAEVAQIVVLAIVGGLVIAGFFSLDG